MKICIISQYFWPENFQINGLAKALADKNHQVTVLTGMPNYPSGKLYKNYRRIFGFRENWCGIEIIRVPLIPRGNARNWRLMLNYLSFALSSMLFILFFSRRLKPEVILVFQPSPITQALPAILMRWIKKIPACLWVQDIWPESLLATKKIQSKLFIKLIDKLVAFVYQHMDINFVQSKAFFPCIERYGISAKKILYLPNTADDFYKPLCLLSQDKLEKILPRGFRILFAGNIGSAQAIPTILKAAEHLRQSSDIKWIFVGEGSERHFLQQQIIAKKLQDLVVCLGSYPSDEMPYLFAAVDVLLVTLNKNNIFSITIPSKVQSYLASGKPILAALDGEGARVIEEAQAGLTVAAENSEELALAVLSMRNKSINAREELGENGYFYFHKHFAQEKLIHNLEYWFNQLIKNEKNYLAK